MTWKTQEKYTLGWLVMYMSRVKVCDSYVVSSLFSYVVTYFVVLIGHMLNLSKCATYYFHDFNQL